MQGTTYVIDTNVLIDYPEIIPNGDNFRPEEASINLDGAHLVIPTAVIRELSNHKKEMNDRGVACRTVLKRLKKLLKNHYQSMYETYNLKNPISIRDGSQSLSILPVHKDFSSMLPFAPADDDMDGQIILAALTALYLKCGLMKITKYNIEFSSAKTYSTIFPTLEEDALKGDDYKKVILLTNDNGLIERAHVRGISSANYSYKLPAPYTGRRELTVPPALFEDFFIDKFIEKSNWETQMPNEPPLIANEFIIMHPEGDEYPGAFDPNYDFDNFSYIGRYDKKSEKIIPLKYFCKLDVPKSNPGQAIYAEALMDPSISAVICTGPAGTGKTYMATVYAYTAYKRGEFIGISVVPCQTENSYGYLPGDLNEKLDPNVKPIKRAIRNYLLKNDKEIRKEFNKIKKFGVGNDKSSDRDDDSSIKKENQKSLKARLDDQTEMIWDNWFGEPIPIENARGDDFAYEVALFDEFQDQNLSQAKTLLTRLGEDGKIIITGDIEQIHAAYLDKANNGLTYARNLLKDLDEVAQVTFTEDEVVRNRLVQSIIQRLNGKSS